MSNCVPFEVPGSLTSSSSTAPSPASPSSSSQDSVCDVNRYTENPVQERSGSASEELRGNPLHPQKPKTNMKMVNQKSNCLTNPVASSLVCTSPLDVITVVGLLDVLTVSNSAESRSFLLTMCMFTPESTTNGSVVDAAGSTHSSSRK